MSLLKHQYKITKMLANYQQKEKKNNKIKKKKWFKIGDSKSRFTRPKINK